MGMGLGCAYITFTLFHSYTRVWVWGWGVHGQLGLGTCDDVFLPTHASSMDGLMVSFISAGFNHTALISHSVREIVSVYAGNIIILLTRANCILSEMVRERDGDDDFYYLIGMYGQLGHGNQEKQTTPTLVYALNDKLVYLVGCGTAHTVSIYIYIYIYMYVYVYVHMFTLFTCHS